MRRWKGSTDWEEIGPLGKGGQSEVFLVRNSARIAERKKHLNKVSNNNDASHLAVKWTIIVLRGSLGSNAGRLR
jgi:hypothetical protein